MGPSNSIFISYASADRAAARSLSQTLAAAGLDVWLDEEELAGGEAWDAKIRQQIRSCTYFMPVVSATTEARREGYFRREWRFAVERTLDLADDVTFLVPVVIDDTPEQNARVPEKFTSVQWLRCPGGQETAGLVALARRLATHENDSPAVALPPKSESMRAAGKSGRSTARTGNFPPFPEFPAPGHRARFVYDLVVWSGRMFYATVMILPRWVRVLVVIVCVFKLISQFSGRGKYDVSSDDSSSRTNVQAPVNVNDILAKVGNKAKAEAAARKVMEAAGTAIDSLQSNRPVALVTFSVGDESMEKPAEMAFDALQQSLSGDDHAAQIAVSVLPLPADASETALAERAALLKCHWLLVGTARPAEGDSFTLALKLFDRDAGKVIWQAERSGPRSDAAALGQAFAAGISEHVSFAPPSATP